MSRFITNAGAFYSYVSQGIGRPIGVGASILAFVAYNVIQIGIYGMFGFQVSTFIEAKTGLATPWWLWIFVCIAIVAVLGVNRVDFSAKVIGVLVALEFLVVIVFDVIGFGNPAEGFSAEPISPAAFFVVPGIGAILVFGIAAFMGFESDAIYSEESKDPKRTIPRATYLAIAIIGIFYAISSWALALAIGPEKITSGGITAEEAGPPLFFNVVFENLGEIWVDIMSLLFITSLFAALISFHNAVARYAFSLGREGVLPRGLGSLRVKSGSPWVGSLLQTVIAALVIVGFAIGESGWDPELGPYPVITLFTWLTNLGAFGLVLLMALVSLAVIGFFAKNRRDVSVWARIVAPVIAFVSLATIWVLILMNWDVLLGQAESTPITFVLPAVLLVPAVLAVLWALWLRRARPQVYRQIGHGAESEAAPHLGAEPVGI